MLKLKYLYYHTNIKGIDINDVSDTSDLVIRELFTTLPEGSLIYVNGPFLARC